MVCQRVYYPLLFALIFLLSVLAAYSHTLKSPFLFDDFPNIVYNEHVKIQNLSKETIARVWQAPHPCKRRKIANFTFALNYLWGEYNLTKFHLVNIIIHIACGLLAAVFFSQILKTGWLAERYGDVCPWLAWGAALLWGLHPLQINAVTYIVQRMTSLAVLFALLALIAWMKGRRYWEKSCRGTAFLFWTLGASAWGLGLLCKEHIAILPALVLIHEFFLFREGNFELKGRWILLAAAAIALIPFLYLGPSALNQILSGYGQRDFNLIERLMTQARVLWHYLSLFCFPLPDRFSILYDYPVSRGLFTPLTTIVSIVGWIGILVLIMTRRKRWPIFSWMAAWYLTAHLIESTVIPLEIIYEHRMYLPSLGLSLGSVLLVFNFISKKISKPRLQLALLIAVLLIVGYATYIRNSDFKDEITLYRAELSRHPNYERIRLNLALALNRSGHFSEGGKRLEELVKEFSHDVVIQQNWYNFIVRVRKDMQSAESTYQHIIKLIKQGHYHPHTDSGALWNLFFLLRETGQHNRALFIVESLLADFDNSPVWFYKGICHAALDDWHSAADAFREAWKKKPEDPFTLYWYGKSLLLTDSGEKGCRLLHKAVHHSADKKIVIMSQNLIKEQCIKDSQR